MAITLSILSQRAINLNKTDRRTELRKSVIKLRVLNLYLLVGGVPYIHQLHGHMSGDSFSTGQLQCSVDYDLSEIALIALY